MNNLVYFDMRSTDSGETLCQVARTALETVLVCEIADRGCLSGYMKRASCSPAAAPWGSPVRALPGGSGPYEAPPCLPLEGSAAMELAAAADQDAIHESQVQVGVCYRLTLRNAYTYTGLWIPGVQSCLGANMTASRSHMKKRMASNASAVCFLGLAGTPCLQEGLM